MRNHGFSLWEVVLAAVILAGVWQVSFAAWRWQAHVQTRLQWQQQLIMLIQAQREHYQRFGAFALTEAQLARQGRYVIPVWPFATRWRFIPDPYYNEQLFMRSPLEGVEPALLLGKHLPFEQQGNEVTIRVMGTP
ncbi:hypothetical protein DFP83_101160 [Idiomarina fontislapidosi]|uniref:Type II secretion system protein n=1 Tax=Idiomarina fontislapidosi TaxID=263723 RepID=A0A432YB39_9GAMM|nr:hypothetical protein [Idiomarina fontislapidosi]PYE35285.1 hypothetical protein DFP83_101160 [Idiomarina fontislapidosi]RUO58174.1 hypothetical protein CWE25_00820 [Idiomarina fontislapidosi]